jgi:Lon-like ATP-dependent protease
VKILQTYLIKVTAKLVSFLSNKKDVVSLMFAVNLLVKQLKKKRHSNFYIISKYVHDDQWVLRYVAGKNIGEWYDLFPHEVEESIETLSNDSDHRVREATAFSISYLLINHYQDFGQAMNNLVVHSNEIVRSTVSLAFVDFIKEQPSHYHNVLDKWFYVLVQDQGKRVKNYMANFVIGRTLFEFDPQTCEELFKRSMVENKKTETLLKAAKSLKKNYSSNEELLILLKKFEEMRKGINLIETTKDIILPENLVDQVVGQEEAVELIKRASKQRRSILMVGEPGTGKSMLGAALAEIMSSEKLQDVLVSYNQNQPINPLVSIVKAGQGKNIIQQAKQKHSQKNNSINIVFGITLFTIVFVSIFYFITRSSINYIWGGSILLLLLIYGKKFIKTKQKWQVPKLLVSSSKNKTPFIDATGFHAGALFGDVRHDPYQSGGMETPPHQLVEAGAIHQAHNGVLFIDEVSTLNMESQQSLLTAFQEKELPITGKNTGSSGAMIRTEAVPSDFILVLAGNYQDIKKMHPALRSRIRGYGYEIVMNTEMDDTEANRYKLAQFVAQEIRKDGKIPHFNKDALNEIIIQAQYRTRKKGKLTTHLRELGGLVRAAGDIAIEEGFDLVHSFHVSSAVKKVRPLEMQFAQNGGNLLHKIGSIFSFHMIADSTPSLVSFHVLKSKNKGVQLIGNLSKTIYNDEKFLNVLVESWANEEQSLFGAYLEVIKVEEFYLQEKEKIEGNSLAGVVELYCLYKGFYLDMQLMILGYIGIDGKIRSSNNIQSKIEKAVNMGFTYFIIPSLNQKQIIKTPDSVKFYYVNDWQNVVNTLDKLFASTYKI